MNVSPLRTVTIKANGFDMKNKPKYQVTLTYENNYSYTGGLVFANQLSDVFCKPVELELFRKARREHEAATWIDPEK